MQKPTNRISIIIPMAVIPSDVILLSNIYSERVIGHHSDFLEDIFMFILEIFNHRMYEKRWKLINQKENIE